MLSVLAGKMETEAALEKRGAERWKKRSLKDKKKNSRLVKLVNRRRR